MDRKNEGPPFTCLGTQQSSNPGGLAEIEGIERFVHEEQRVRREQSQRQHQPSAVTLRKRVHALVKNRRQAYRFDCIRDLVDRSPIDKIADAIESVGLTP